MKKPSRLPEGMDKGDMLKAHAKIIEAREAATRLIKAQVEIFDIMGIEPTPGQIWGAASLELHVVMTESGILPKE